jgi:pilus assembly protein CpaB
VAVALVAAAGSTVVFYKLISGSLRANAGYSGPTRQIVAAARDLPRGSELTTADLRLVDWPSAALPAGAFEDRTALEGRFTSHEIVAGEPLLVSRLASGSAGGATAIPLGMRAVSVHVGEYAGVTELLEAGDRVDVLVADGAPGPGRSGIKMQTILEDVVVLATGREVTDKGPGGRIPVVTLLVDAADTNSLSLADHTGVIRLALRNPLDRDGDKITAATAGPAGAREDSAARLSAMRK